MKCVKKAEKSPWTVKKSKPGPKKKSKADFCNDKKKGLAESGKGSWHDTPKEEMKRTSKRLLLIFFSFPHFYGVLKFKKEK